MIKSGMRIEHDHDITLEEYEQSVLQEIRNQSLTENPISSRVKHIYFESRSAGKGRKRKTVESVELLVVDKSHAYVVKDGEVKNRRDNLHIAPDILANEILFNLPYDERTPERLVTEAKRIKGIKG
jgi:hypothetical protein